LDPVYFPGYCYTGNIEIEIKGMSKRIVILGAGESGVGAALLAKAKGFEAFVSDMSAVKENYKNILLKHAIPFEENKHTEELILNADEIVKSPGIPDKAPLIKKIKERAFLLFLK